MGERIATASLRTGLAMTWLFDSLKRGGIHLAFVCSDVEFGIFTWSGAGLLFEGIVKSADAVKTAI